MTADPYRASAGPRDPGSWNRYAYTRGDPVNRMDPSGLDDCGDDPYSCTVNGGSAGTVTPGTAGIGPLIYGSGGGFCESWGFPTLEECGQAVGACAAGGSYTLAGGADLCSEIGVDAYAPKNRPTLTGTTKNRSATFQSAWGSAWDDLQKSGCASLFGTTATAASLRTKLENANFVYGTTTAGTEATTNYSTQTVTINDQGNFMNGAWNQSVSVPVGTNTYIMTADQYRAYILLHELGHLNGLGTLPDENGYDNYFNHHVIEDCIGIK